MVAVQARRCGAGPQRRGSWRRSCAPVDVTRCGGMLQRRRRRPSSPGRGATTSHGGVATSVPLNSSSDGGAATATAGVIRVERGSSRSWSTGTLGRRVAEGRSGSICGLANGAQRRRPADVGRAFASSSNGRTSRFVPSEWIPASQHVVGAVVGSGAGVVGPPLLRWRPGGLMR